MTNSEALVKVRGYLTDYLPLDDADEIDEIIKTLEQTRLIPCSERLPKRGQEVLLFDKNFGYVVGTYEMVNYFGAPEPGFLIHKSIDSPEKASIDPIAWMPLPEPYAESKIEQALAYAEQDTLMSAT